MYIQSIYCDNCEKKTPHAEELNETFLSCWHCLVCGEENRPGGNSCVLAGPPDGYGGRDKGFI